MVTSDTPLFLVVEVAKRLEAHADATPSLKGADQAEFTKTFAKDLVALGGAAREQMYKTVTDTLQRCADGDYGGLSRISVEAMMVMMEKLPMSDELAPAHELIDTVLQARAFVLIG